MTKPKTELKTVQLAARVTPTTSRRIDDLASIWGPVVPLSQSDVISKAVDLAWAKENSKKVKNSV